MIPGDLPIPQHGLDNSIVNELIRKYIWTIRMYTALLLIVDSMLSEYNKINKTTIRYQINRVLRAIFLLILQLKNISKANAIYDIYIYSVKRLICIVNVDIRQKNK